MSVAVKRRILLIDDDASFISTIQTILDHTPYEITAAHSASQGLQLAHSNTFDVVLLDVILPDNNGLEVLRILKSRYSEIDVIMLTANKDIRQVVQAIQLGAYFYLTKDTVMEDLLLLLERVFEKRSCLQEIATLRCTVDSLNQKEMYLGNNDVCRNLRSLVTQIADLPSTVLIQGESGTGKELLARAIHNSSSKPNAPFIPINLCAVPKNLVESELFGHEKGAFTGATHQRIGKCELAHGGTLFLDEIGDIELDIQVKLLRFLQEGEFQRVGSNRTIKVSTRVIAATNRDLHEAMRDGKFRRDLYYRLNVIPIAIPSLRERIDDIPYLTEYFIRYYCKKFSRPGIMRISKSAMSILQHYPWPGNIRELEHLIERLVGIHRKDVIDGSDIPLEFVMQDVLIDHKSVVLQDKSTDNDQSSYYKNATSHFEKKLIHQMLLKNGGNRKKTAERLGIPLSTLKFRMQKLGVRNEAGVE